MKKYEKPFMKKIGIDAENIMLISPLQSWIAENEGAESETVEYDDMLIYGE